MIQLDLNDFDATRSLLEEKRPRYLVHSAAQRFPDKVSQYYLNLILLVDYNILQAYHIK